MGRQNKSGGIYVWTHLFKIFYDRACIFVYIYIDIFNNLYETLQSNPFNFCNGHNIFWSWTSWINFESWKV